MNDRSTGFVESRRLFGAAFLLGSALTILLSLVRVPALIPAGVAITVMFGYYALAKTWAPESTRHPDFPDSFYYLGFLLTLVALVSTLYRIGDGGDSSQAFVLQNFGVALATTIVGLAGRTLMRMFSDDSIESEVSAAHRRLSEASERFRQILDRSATDMRTTLGAAQESVSSGAQQISGSLEVMGSRVAETNEAFTPLVERFESLSQQATRLESRLGLLGEVSRDLSEPVGDLKPRVEAVDDRFAQLRGRLEELDGALASTMDVMKSIKPTALALNESIAPLNRVTESVERLSDVSSGISQLGSAVSGGKDALDQFTSQIRTAERGLRQMSDLPSQVDFSALQTLQHSLAQQVEGLKTSIQTWRQGVQSLDGLVREVERRQRAAAEALLTVQDELKASVAVLTESVDGGSR